MIYNWQHKKWPEFTYDSKAFDEEAWAFHIKTGRFSGLIEGLSSKKKLDAIISMMVSEAMTTSAIEGEFYSRQDVFSSIQKNLGIAPTKSIKNQQAEGIASLVVDINKKYNKPLSQAELFNWHRLLMKSNSKIKVGKWRSSNEPMRVVSGAIGKEIIHFEAPPSGQVHEEMKSFIKWFNDTAPGKSKPIKNALIRSAVAHVYFESIHPFEDGNGRIGRALSEKVLSQSIGQPIVLSLSKTISNDKKAYYNALKQAQSTLYLSEWITYFSKIILEAQAYAEKEIIYTIKKTQFFDEHKNHLNKRQMKVVNKMLDNGTEVFEGGMTAKKYMSITKTSKATSTRDLQDLHDKKVLKSTGGGRSTSYQLMIHN